MGAQVEDFREQNQVSFDDVRSVADQQSLCGIHNIVGRHAVMQPAGGRRIADGLADSHREGDDVVLHFGFQFVDSRDVNLGARAQGGCGRLGDLPRFRERVGCGKFHVEPFLVAIGVAPNAAHLFPSVAWDHFGVSKPLVMIRYFGG